MLLLRKLYRNCCMREINIKQHFKLIQKVTRHRLPFISLSSPPALWCKSVQLPKYLTPKTLELAAIEDDDDCSGERLSDYGPGGYMHCEPGQQLGPQKQYRIIRKLGWGHFSTVWLCENTETRKYQAIKISKSGNVFKTVAQDEIRLLEYIRRKTPEHSSYDKIIILQDHFQEQSKTVGYHHMCLSFDVMGPTLWELLVDNGFKGFEQSGVKAVIKQVLMALTYLHENCHIIHTDIKPENILVSVKESYVKQLVEYAESFPRQSVQMPRSYVTTLDWKDRIDTYGKPSSSNSYVSFISTATATHDDSAIYSNQAPTQSSIKLRSPLPIFFNKNIQVKLADLGNSCLENRHLSRVIQTVQYRALEVLLEANYSYAADIWSVACVAFELSTGEYLFNPQETRHLSLTQDHIGLIWEVLGGIPDYIAKGGQASYNFFHEDGTPNFIPVRNLKIWKVENVLIEKYKWRPVDAISLGNFIQLLIEPDPELRATASGALELEWLKE